MQELVEMQADLDRDRAQCLDRMKQSQIDSDQIGYLVAKGCHQGILIALDNINRRILRILEAA